MKSVPSILIFITALLLASWLRPRLVEEQKGLAKLLSDDTPIYLPEAKYVRLVTLGFDELAADLIWFYTHNYFGRQFQAKASVRWLGHMCELVTTLSPKAMHVYDFCSTTLSWVAQEPEASNRLLSRGILALPDSWRLPYLRAFNYWYFLEDRKRAIGDLELAASRRGAPPFIASLTSRLLAEEGDATTAISFLTEFYRREKSTEAKALIREKLQLAVLTRDLQELRKAVTYYQQRYHGLPASLEALVDAGIVKNLPQDPFGGTYNYDPVTNTVGSTSGREELKFSGKTARTGALKHLLQKEDSSPSAGDNRSNTNHE